MTERDVAHSQLAIRMAIDREQRRYEIARDVMAACAGYPITQDPILPLSTLAKAAVIAADALLAELERD